MRSLSAIRLVPLLALLVWARAAHGAPRLDLALGPAFGQQGAFPGASNFGVHLTLGLLFPVWRSPTSSVRIELGIRASSTWYGLDHKSSAFSANSHSEGWTGLTDLAFEARLVAAVSRRGTMFVAPAIGLGVGAFTWVFVETLGDGPATGTTCNHQGGEPAGALHLDVAFRWEPTLRHGFFIAPGLTVMAVLPSGGEGAFNCETSFHTTATQSLDVEGARLSASIDLGWQYRF